MSNSYTTPPNLPNTNALIAGREIESTTLQRMGELVNYCHAYGSTTNCISQTFDDQTCIRDVASSALVCRWLVPTVSDQHTSMTFHIDAKVTTGTGVIILTITDGSTIGTQSIYVTATTTTYHTITVSYGGSTSVEYLEVQMGLEAPSSGEIEVLTITGVWDSLSSPLSAGVAERDGEIITPMGINRLGANNALSSRAGLNIKESIISLRRRPRPIWVWSGITNVSSASSNAAEGPQALGMGDLPTIHIAQLFQGYLDDTVTSKVVIAAYVVNITTVDIEFDFMGDHVVFSANGWQFKSIDVDVNSLVQFLDVGIPVYPVGFDNSQGNQSGYSTNVSPFIDITKSVSATTAPVVPYIASFTAWIY
tara:strand:- start:3856 stop:4950 length:1095 start_codon:yes stop_codon:yes gene_type:complete